MTIKEITTPDEKSQICNTVLRALPNWFGNEDAIVKYANDARDMPFYCAYDDHNPVGFVSIKVHNPHTADIYVIGILQPHHGQGIGRKLIEICENFCRTHGMEFLTVKTLADTHPDPYYAKTRMFYETMGFKPLEIFPLHWDESSPCLLMAKQIQLVGNPDQLKLNFKTIETFMLDKMKDSAHDKHHIYRVLNIAKDIAKHEPDANTDILITACLLHDIGRDAQAANPNICHAQTGGERAYEFLLTQNWPLDKAAHVRDCISSHRFRGDNTPQTIEAKILFDADKLEAAGAIGIARTLIYAGQIDSPLYILNENEIISTNRGDGNSFVTEYNYKLKNVYNSFHTARAKEIAAKRKKTAEDFYNALVAEATMKG